MYALAITLLMLAASASANILGLGGLDHARAADALQPLKLPESLLIGAGISALQTEGAWNVSGELAGG